MTQAEKLWLGGRAYRYPVRMTVRQDLYCMMHARHAGLVGAERAEGETKEAFMQRLMDQLLGSGRALLLLGGLLLPEDKADGDWTVDVAEETAASLGAIQDEDEKRRLWVELASALLAFFVKGLGSWVASASSSAERKDGQTRSSGPGESGPGSSERSPASIPSAASA